MRFRIATLVFLLALSRADSAEMNAQSLYDQEFTTKDKLLSRAKDEAQDAAISGGIVDAECQGDRKFGLYDMIFINNPEYDFQIVGDINENIKQHYSEEYSESKKYAKREMFSNRREYFKTASSLKSPEHVSLCLKLWRQVDSKLKILKQTLIEMKAMQKADRLAALGEGFYLRKCPSSVDREFGETIFREAVKRGEFSTEELNRARNWGDERYSATEGLECEHAHILAGALANPALLAAQSRTSP